MDSWALRPEATTATPNLFFASDYVRTHTDLATMERANEAARRAVNGMLDATGFAGATLRSVAAARARDTSAMAVVRRSAIRSGPAVGRFPGAGRGPRAFEGVAASRAGPPFLNMWRRL